jgi:hypothetical protein
VAKGSSLGMTFVPVHSVYAIGDAVSVNIHGILGFTEVILKIITTVDAELSKTSVGESALIGTIKSQIQRPLLKRRLLFLFNTLGWKDVTITPELSAFLAQHHIVS